MIHSLFPHYIVIESERALLGKGTPQFEAAQSASAITVPRQL